MEYEAFLDWLQAEKDFSKRSASDTVSRVRRVQKITNEKKITKNTTEKLLKSREFEALSSHVKAQLKRAITLYEDFCIS